MELQRSHMLPAAIYRLLRGDPSQGNPNPFMITPRTIVPTSDQIVAHLLCRDCEQRFSAKGESWIFKNGLQKDGSSPIVRALGHHRPVQSQSDGAQSSLFHGSQIPEIDTAAITYFAASIFWRASAYPWASDRTIPVKLGPYAERLRRFLMDEEPFPDEAALWVAIRRPGPLSRLTYLPTSERKGGMWVHNFPLPGLALTLLVDWQLNDRFRRLDFAHRPERPFLLTAVVEPHLEDIARKAWERSNETSRTLK